MARLFKFFTLTLFILIPLATQAAPCTPNTNSTPPTICLNLPCATIGETTLDGNQENILSCLKDSSGNAVWKSNTSSSSSKKIIGGVGSVNGCGGPTCAYTVFFSEPFAAPPSSVVCSAGPNSNGGWAVITCVVRAIYRDKVSVYLDASSSRVSGPKKIYLMGIE